MIFTLASLVLLLIGAGCGIVALTSVGRHGRQGILVPGLIGTMLCTVYLIVIGGAFYSATSNRHQRQIERIADHFQREVPKMVDSETELVMVTAGPGELVVDYRFPNHTSLQVEPAAFLDAVRPQVKQLACTQLSSLPSDFRYRARYTSADEVQLADIVVAGTECR